jgi:hypothetical protein
VAHSLQFAFGDFMQIRQPAFLTALLLVVRACGAQLETDSFGIQKIYADAPALANTWSFGGNPRDPRFMEQYVIPTGDGWFRPSDSQEMRLEVLSDTALTEESIPTFDLAKVLAKGYLFKSPDSPDGKGDFLNIEQTWRFKVLVMGTGTTNGGPHVELVPGGYRQTSSRGLVGQDKAVPASCESMSYHFNIYPATGRAKLEKDSDHTSGYAVESTNPERKNAVLPFADGRQIVEKAVLYRTSAGMKLELYLDVTGKGDHFQRVLEYEDRGQWGPTDGGNSECHASEFVVLSMARVAIGYRCDDMVNFQFKDMSIRSIDPSRPLHRPPVVR